MYLQGKEIDYMSLKERWEKDKNPLQPVKNENLTCRTCKHKIPDRVVNCQFYETKPVSVLKGGVCDGYRKAK